MNDNFSCAEDMDPDQAALLVESVMLDVFEGTTANYKAKFRQLFNNLKNPKNPELRQRVLAHHIQPDVLVSMTSQVSSCMKHYPSIRGAGTSYSCVCFVARGGGDK